MEQVLTTQEYVDGSVSWQQVSTPDLPSGMGFFRRACSYVIDYALVFLLTMAVAATMVGLDDIALRLPGRMWLHSEPQLWDLVVSVLLYISYFTLFEWLYGATPGKVLLRMRVIPLDGTHCTFASALVRSAIRPIDGLLFGLIAASNMRQPLNQRWGDKVAHTMVVGSRDPGIRVRRPWWHFLLAVLASVLLTAGACVLFAAIHVV